MSGIHISEMVGDLWSAFDRLLRKVYDDGPQGWGFVVARETPKYGDGEIFICVARGRAAIELRRFIEHTQKLQAQVPPRKEEQPH